MEDLKKAVKENQNLLSISLLHKPTKEKLDYGRGIATEFSWAYELITDDKVIGWLIDLRADLCKNLTREELDWLVVQIKQFKDYIWGKI